MPQEKIIIKFEPSGDKRLVSAINALRDAQISLESKTKKVKQTFTALNPKMLQIHSSLKVQGKSWKDLGISIEMGNKALRNNKNAVALVNARLQALGITQAQVNKGTLLGVRNNRLLANSFATLRSQLLLVSFGAMLIERAFISLVKAYGRQEAANEKLRVGLGNVQDTTEGVTQRLVDYSAALQQVTAFGDEMITTGMVQFTTFGLNEKAIKALTPQVLNVARGIQTVSGTMPDLNSLFIAFGKATTTGIGTLTRYGVVLTENERSQLKNMDANESAVKIAEILARQYGGLSEAYANTTAGMLEATDLARGDAAEAFGEVLAPAVLAVAKGLKTMFEAMSVENIKAYGSGLIIAASAMTGLALATGRLNFQLAITRTAMIRTGFGVLVVGAGALIGKLLNMFDVFEDGEDTLTDAEKSLLKFNSALKDQSSELAEATKLSEEYKEAQHDIAMSILVLNAQLRGDTTQEIAALQERIRFQKEWLKLIPAEGVTMTPELEALIKLLKEEHRLRLEKIRVDNLLSASGKEELTALDKKIAKLKEARVEQAEFITAIKDTKAALTDSSSAMSLEVESFSEVSLRVNEYAENLAKISELEAVPKEASKITTIFKEWGEEVNFTIPIIGSLSEAIDESSKKHQEGIANEIQALKDRNDELVTAGMEAPDEGKFVALSKTTDEYNEQITLLREIAGINKIMAEFEPPKTFAEQADAIIDDNAINALLLTEEEKEKIRDHFRGLEKEANMQAIQEGLDMSLAAIGGLLSAQQGKLDAEMAAMKAGDEFQNASTKKREAMETAMQQKQSKERTKIAQKEKLASIAQATMSVYESVVAALGAKPYGFWNIALAAAVGAMGFAQVSAIASTPIPTFAAGGMIGGRRHSQGGTMINAEQGEFVMNRSAVQSVGLENLNAMNAGGGGGAVTVNVSGNVLSQDFVEGELAENIKEAIRRGTDFGIS